MKQKKFYKKLFLGKSTVANLNNLMMRVVKGGGCVSDPEPSCVSELPECDTLSDCNVTVGKPYACPTQPPASTCYPECG